MALVADLRRALLADLQEEVEVALRVAVLAAGGYTEREIAVRLGLTPAEVRRAIARLRRVKPALERYAVTD